MKPLPNIPVKPLSIWGGLFWGLLAVVAFHLAYLVPACPWFIAVFLYGVLRLAELATARQAARFGLVVGLAAYSYHLAFFWTLFGAAAIALWWVLAFWLGLFVLVGRACRFRFGPVVWAVTAPFLWTGLEYFRSELYYLRFSWLNAGYAFSKSGALHFLSGFGVYGIGFVLMSWASYIGVVVQLSKVARVAAFVALAALSSLPLWLPAMPSPAVKPINIVGVQLEGAGPGQVKSALDAALKKHPQTDLFVLSEYAFMGPIPPAILNWCKEHHRWLAAGGEETNSPTQYYNTAFVVGPDGALAFQQAKCVPVQFMADGMPARSQQLWDSPWGKLGFGLCYDASYTRVTDELMRQGAQGLIFPTMDQAEWGRAEHELHSRIAPMRAAEYGVPVFRLCSSGISEFVGRDGKVLSSAPYPGQDALLCAEMELPPRGRMPLDRPLAEFSVVAAGALILFLIFDAILSHRRPV
jgi:apolipoprotein N-acyltransferase